MAKWFLQSLHSVRKSVTLVCYWLAKVLLWLAASLHWRPTSLLLACNKCYEHANCGLLSLLLACKSVTFVSLSLLRACKSVTLVCIGVAKVIAEFATDLHKVPQICKLWFAEFATVLHWCHFVLLLACKSDHQVCYGVAFVGFGLLQSCILGELVANLWVLVAK